jgi:hypothetical protein
MATIVSDAETISPNSTVRWYFAYHAGDRTSAGWWFHRTGTERFPKSRQYTITPRPGPSGIFNEAKARETQRAAGPA